MKIGFDVSQTGRTRAGCGYFADSLIQQLAQIDARNEYLLYPTFGDFFWDNDWQTTIGRIARPNFRLAKGHASLDEAKGFWRQTDRNLDDELGAPDIVHANNFFCPVGLRRARLVYTLYDLGFLEQPEWTTEANRIGCFNGAFKASLYADQVVAISEFSRQHFLSMFPHYPPERTEVIHLASRYTDRQAVERPAPLPKLQSRGFWLHVGTIEPRKNHATLLKAYARLKHEAGRCLPLVLTGGDGWLMQGFQRQIEDLGLAEDIVLTGYVNERTLQWLYQNCFAFVYPSLWEGFGLPVLEAMSQGAPVITSDGSSLREIAGDAAALVDPSDDVQLSRTMGRLLTDDGYRTSLCSRSLRRAGEFSWKSAAAKLLSCYERLLATAPTEELARAV